MDELSNFCEIEVLKLYESVINDVIESCYSLYGDEGLDKPILDELKLLWLSKLKHSEKSDNPRLENPIQETPVNTLENPIEVPSEAITEPAPSVTTTSPAPVSTTSPALVQTVRPQRVDPYRLVGIQIVLPQNRVVHLQVPQIVLTEQQLQSILSASVIQATLGMNAAQAGAFLQQHVNASYQSQVRSLVLTRIVNQLDGQFDSKTNSDSEEFDTSSSSQDDFSNDESNPEDYETEIFSKEVEPLNSNDDVSDDEDEDLFETENVIVCQYEKIMRTKNQWKLCFKDGIMNINGKDYTFHRLFGSADW